MSVYQIFFGSPEDAAATTDDAIAAGAFPQFVTDQMMEFKDALGNEAALQGLIGKYDNYSDAYVYVTLCDLEGVLATYEQRWNQDYRTSPDLFVFPESAWLRDKLRWKEQVRKDAILDSWRKHGFPQQCKPHGDDDFECD